MSVFAELANACANSIDIHYNYRNFYFWRANCITHLDFEFFDPFLVDAEAQFWQAPVQPVLLSIPCVVFLIHANVVLLIIHRVVLVLVLDSLYAVLLHVGVDLFVMSIAECLCCHQWMNSFSGHKHDRVSIERYSFRPALDRVGIVVSKGFSFDPISFWVVRSIAEALKRKWKPWFSFR